MYFKTEYINFKQERKFWTSRVSEEAFFEHLCIINSFIPSLNIEPPYVPDTAHRIRIQGESDNFCLQAIHIPVGATALLTVNKGRVR